MATSFSILLDDDSRFVICEKCQPYYFSILPTSHGFSSFINAVYLFHLMILQRHCQSLRWLMMTCCILSMKTQALLFYCKEGSSQFLWRFHPPVDKSGFVPRMYSTCDSFYTRQQGIEDQLLGEFIGFWFSLICLLIVYLYSGFSCHSFHCSHFLGMYTRG